MSSTTHPFTPTIRPLRRGETAVVQAVFDGLSPRSRFLRFHTGLPRLSSAMLRRLGDVREGEHTAYVAEVAGQPVGLVRWLRMPTEPTAADVAVEVVDAHHRLGIGLLLIEAAARSAWEAGIREFAADVSGDNHPVRRWLVHLGLRADPVDHHHFRIPVAMVRESMRAARSA
jgi:GNAT superfamily N-acetyltransferase